jgi:hypothetical protein
MKYWYLRFSFAHNELAAGGEANPISDKNMQKVNVKELFI